MSELKDKIIEELLSRGYMKTKIDDWLSGPE